VDLDKFHFVKKITAKGVSNNEFNISSVVLLIINRKVKKSGVAEVLLVITPIRRIERYTNIKKLTVNVFREVNLHR